MVNASLNWASIVGIVLAVCGGGLYFLRSFKPALARDYDVFFAAIGLLCGGILFFQGWRLDPILQFGQFLLAGTTVFFAYESVRLRGVATDQARRSSFFEDDPISDVPRNSRGRFNDEYERFEEAERPSRRFKPQQYEFEEDYVDGVKPRSRDVSRAIPASAVSRRRTSREVNQFENEEPIRRRRNSEDRSSNASVRNNFGDRRNSSRNEVKTGSRPRMNQRVLRQDNITSSDDSSPLRKKSTSSSIRPQVSKEQVEDASFKDANTVKKPRVTRRASTSRRSSSKNQNGRYTVGMNRRKPRDNSSRFDD
ncbi:Ycf66 family protein [uncultured Prochlorococcus sp.]|uniref:Ycf66 family protein n=1 Tax=uncultured Prochlorococcus sp. TaxID=159733 RepID=UPI00258D4A45|nr:Ycf66 family protein [uncultured Prochlorococcus sp.]